MTSRDGRWGDGTFSDSSKQQVTLLLYRNSWACLAANTSCNMLGISRVRLKVTASKLGSFSSLLQVKVDAYNGVTVTEDITSLSDEDFEDRLAFSMKSWKADSRKGVWLRLPITHSQLIPVAVEQDFWFHHAGEDYLLLCNWLQGGRSQSKLPPRASHYVGVSGFVLNSREEVLVIQEESGPASEMGLWKLPGGLVDSGESLEGGSVREVKEETGEWDIHIYQLVRESA